jgi:hypothetical protein
MPGGTEATRIPDADAAQLYLQLFHADEVERLAHLIATIRAHRESLLQQWRELYESVPGARLGYSEQLFHETYVPYLRSALLRLGAGDAEGFAKFCAILGEHPSNSASHARSSTPRSPSTRSPAGTDPSACSRRRGGHTGSLGDGITSGVAGPRLMRTPPLCPPAGVLQMAAREVPPPLTASSGH